MAKAPPLNDITNILNSTTIINSNWDAIQASFENTLSLDGSTPNQMQADLDLNSNNLLNIARIDADDLYINGSMVTDLTAVPTWKSEWATATSYNKNDLVRESGSSYICLVDHTSGTFSTDLTANYWELFAQQGSPGAGTGDMLAANNLSDVVSAATSRTNLGLGTVATQNTVPVSMGGTNAPDAPTARINLGLEIGADVQAFNTYLDNIANISYAEGDILGFSGTAVTKLGIGTEGQVLTVSSGYPSWQTPSTVDVETMSKNFIGIYADKGGSNSTIQILNLDGLSEILIDGAYADSNTSSARDCDLGISLSDDNGSSWATEKLWAGQNWWVQSAQAGKQQHFKAFINLDTGALQIIRNYRTWTSTATLPGGNVNAVRFRVYGIGGDAASEFAVYLSGNYT